MKKTLAAMVAGRVVASLAQALMLLLLARLITPGEFGAVSALIGFGAFLSVVLDFGLTTYILRQRELPSENRTASVGLVLSYFVGGLILLVVVASAALGITSGLSLGVAALIALWVSLERVGEYQTALLISEHRDLQATIVISVRRLLPLGLFAVLASVGSDPVLWFSVSLCIGALAANGWSFSLLRSLPKPGVRRADVRRILTDSRHFWAASTSAQARELEPWLFQITLGSAAAGLYGVAFRLGKAFLIVTSALTQGMMPSAARGTRGFVIRAIRRTFLLGLLVSILTIPFVPLIPWLLVVVVGPEYAAAAPLVQITIVAAGVVSVSTPLEGLCQALGLERQVAWTGWLAVGASVAGLVIAAWLTGDPFTGTVVVLVVYIAKSAALYVLGTRSAS